MGARIRNARRDRGLTQDDLSRLVGVTRSAVAQWETDRAGQVGATLIRVAAVLGVSSEYLLTGDVVAETVAEGGPELALLRLYRSCSEDDRAYLLRTARLLARAATT